MEVYIDEEIIAGTVDWHKNISCLAIKNEDLCEISFPQFSDSVHFIRCSQGINCGYRIDFNNDKYCLCPTRKEICNKYII